MAGDPLQFSVDTQAAVALARRYKGEAARVRTALIAANTELANELQVAEAVELARVVKNPPGDRGPRPQRHAAGQGPLEQALRSESNREVDANGFTVNNTDFLDNTVRYWRALEVGAQGHRQILRGLFEDPLGHTASGQFAAAGARGGALSRPIEGARSAVRFIQFQGPGAAQIQALIGPADPYEYIATATERVTERWRTTKRALNVYQRALRAAGSELLAGDLLAD